MAITKAKTTCGIVAGLPSEGSDVTSFLGIPYAKPPVGKLRYAAPEPAEPWEGERACTEFAPSCIQLDPPGGALTYRVSEDCLYLNVYTPAGSEAEKLPVLF